MNSKEREKLLLLASQTAAGAVRQVIRSTKGLRRVKADIARDVKIRADYEIEEFIIGSLSRKTDFAILSEERGLIDGKDGHDGYRWIIDPLDGSLNFSRGIPLYCISIGLWKGMEPVLGVVLDVTRNEAFSGIVGKGTRLNGLPVKVSRTSDRSKAVLCTGFPVSTDFSQASLLGFVEDVRNFKKIRLLGSAALSLAYVACGRADFYEENNIKIWDVAAGLALVRAAGGIIDITPTDIRDAFEVKASNKHLLNG